MEIVELKAEEYEQIDVLWKKLNRLHGKLSQNFKRYFAAFTFEKRMKSLLCKEHKTIYVAQDDKGKFIGYCIASIDRGKGEIDSIYIEPRYRKQGIGRSLIQNSLDWLRAKQCETIHIYVAEGNESALDFYKQFGFLKRFVVLQNQ